MAEQNDELRALVMAFLQKPPTGRQAIADRLGVGHDLPERSDEAARLILTRIRERGLVDELRADLFGSSSGDDAGGPCDCGAESDQLRDTIIETMSLHLTVDGGDYDGIGSEVSGLADAADALIDALGLEQKFCPHSMVKWDCNSCLLGYINRQNAHIERLRQMLKGLGGEAPLDHHDRFWFGGNAT